MWDLLARPRSTLRALYKTEYEETIRAFRSKRRVLGADGIVAVAFNESARKRHTRDHERAKTRFLSACQTGGMKVSRPHRGRRSTVQSLAKRI